MSDSDTAESLGYCFAKIEQGLQNKNQIEEKQNACAREMMVLLAAWIFHCSHVDKDLSLTRSSNQDVIGSLIEISKDHSSSALSLQVDISDQLKGYIPQDLLQVRHALFYIPNAVYGLYGVPESGIRFLKDERPFYMVPNENLPPELQQKQVSVVDKLLETAQEFNQFLLRDIRDQYEYRYPLDYYAAALVYIAETSPHTLCCYPDPLDWLHYAIKESNPGENEMRPYEFHTHVSIAERDVREFSLH